MNIRYSLIKTVSILLLLVLGVINIQGELPSIDNMDDISPWKVPKGNKVAASVETEPHEGKGALRIHVKNGNRYATAGRLIKHTAKWSEYEGISFWIKGDGSSNYASLYMQAGKWGTGWRHLFPLKNKEWHKVDLNWKDAVPVSARVPGLGSEKGFTPDNINYMAFGAFWNFNIKHKSYELQFSVDQVELVKKVPVRRLRKPINKMTPLKSVIEKMKTGKPVTILTLGDSITWGTNAGGNKGAYPAVLGKMLVKHFKNDKIKVVNRAIGGSTTSKGRACLERDIKGVNADLITVMFGYNEKAGKDKKKEHTQAFTDNLVRYLEEAAGVMEKVPACVVIATIPGRKGHWESLDCYAEGIRELGKKYPNLTIADANGVFKAMGQPAYAPLMSDEAHPNKKGQVEMGKILFGVLCK
jgi:lysophospholipase L1-like esterase